MKTSTGKAFLQNVLDAAWVYKLGAAMRLGLPDRPPRIVIGGDEQAPPSPTSSSGGILKPALLAAAVGTGLGVAGMSLMGTDKPDTPPPPSSTTTINTSGDLLEWLDDKGVSPK